jgi:hypothetical protein
MKTTSAIISALLAVTQACWVLETAHAQSKQEKQYKSHKLQTKQGQQHDLGQDHRSGRDMPDRGTNQTHFSKGPFKSVLIFSLTNAMRLARITNGRKTKVIAHRALLKRGTTACRLVNPDNGSEAIPCLQAWCITTCPAAWF